MSGRVDERDEERAVFVALRMPLTARVLTRADENRSSASQKLSTTLQKK
jgi:hypothetical protein